MNTDWKNYVCGGIETELLVNRRMTLSYNYDDVIPRHDSNMASE